MKLQYHRKPIEQLSLLELRNELVAAGYAPGPINERNRAIFMKQLTQLRSDAASSRLPMSSPGNGVIVKEEQMDAAGDEQHFQYKMNEALNNTTLWRQSSGNNQVRLLVPKTETVSSPAVVNQSTASSVAAPVRKRSRVSLARDATINTQSEFPTGTSQTGAAVPAPSSTSRPHRTRRGRRSRSHTPVDNRVVIQPPAPTAVGRNHQEWSQGVSSAATVNGSNNSRSQAPLRARSRSPTHVVNRVAVHSSVPTAVGRNLRSRSKGVASAATVNGSNNSRSQAPSRERSRSPTPVVNRVAVQFPAPTSGGRCRRARSKSAVAATTTNANGSSDLRSQAPSAAGGSAIVPSRTPAPSAISGPLVANNDEIEAFGSFVGRTLRNLPLVNRNAAMDHIYEILRSHREN